MTCWLSKIRILSLVIVALFSVNSFASSLPRVQNGTLDLRSWDSDTHPTLTLAGEWKFYWNQKLSPATFDTTKRGEASSAPVPGNWSKLAEPGSHNKLLPQHGVATYAIDIIFNENSRNNLSISLNEIGSSYRLFVIDAGQTTQVLQSGTVGQNAETSQPFIKRQSLPLSAPTNNTLTLLVQVSNFSHDFSGFIKAPELGLSEVIKAQNSMSTLWNFLCLGALLILCISQFTSLLVTEKSRIHTGLGALSFLAVVLLAVRGSFFQLLDPVGTTFTSSFLHQLEAITLIGMAPCLAMLFRPSLARAQLDKTSLITLSLSLLLIGYVYFASLSTLMTLVPALSILLATSCIYLAKGMLNHTAAKSTEKWIWIGGTLLLGASLFINSELFWTYSEVTWLFNAGWVLALGALCQSGTELETRTTRVEPQITKSLQREIAARTASLQEQTDKAVQESVIAKASEYEALEAGFEAEVAREQLAEEKHKQELFVQNISHELRTPLTLILNPLQIVANESPEDSNIQLALHNAQRLLRLVNQLLDFQLLGRGDRAIDIRPVDLVSFVQTCSEYFAYSCLQKHIRFKTTIEGRNLEDVLDSNEKPLLFVLSEVDALEKVIFNLLSNALKFTPDGGEIELGIQSIDNHARVFVTDTGPGIKEEDQERIFNAFAQVDDSETRGFEGTGLGLAYAKRLVESMNGQLDLQSIPDLGSRFWVSLPVCEEPETSGNNTFRVKDWLLADGGYHASEHAQNKPSNVPETNVQSKGSILIVDDLPEMRKLIAHTLGKKGYSIIEAENGKEGFEIASRSKPDLIVTDWMMPIMSGTDLINELKSTAGLSAIPVILLTAKSDKQSKEQAISLGADGFLSKPFEQVELSSMVRNLMKLRTAERQAADEQRKNALSQVAAQLAHELNNPLNFISSGMDNIRDHHDEMESVLNKLMEGTGEEAKSVRDFFQNQFQALDEVVADIQTGVMRSGHVVQEIRSLTGVDGGAIEKMQVLAEIQRQFKALVRENGTHFVGVHLNHLAKENGIYEGNPVIFRRVLLSAIECCAEWALQNDSPEVLVEIDRDKYGSLNLRFGQNGNRFNPDTDPKILDPQEDDAGMGALRRLTLLKSLWQDHGGNISVIRMGMSQRYTGFSVSLPAQSPTVSEPSVTSAKKSN